MSDPSPSGDSSGPDTPRQGPAPELPTAPSDLAARLRLIVITDRRTASAPVEEVVEEALQAGAPCIQLREKELGAGELLEVALRLRELTRAYRALLIVNDRLDLALACGADGVHLGPEDLPVEAVRRAVPASFLIGYSTDSPPRAQQAARQGADYIGCGTIWPTGSKADAGSAIGVEGLAAVARAVEIPVVGIGGITLERTPLLRGTGAAGLAVLSGVMGARDPGEAVRGFLAAF